MILGFIWYNPKVFGKAWMGVTGMTEEKAKQGNMIVIFGLSFVFSFLLAFAMSVLTIHQMHLFSLVMGVEGFGVEGSEVMLWLDDAMAKYGTEFRTFKHGAFHGVIDSLFIVLPVLGTNALFEQKGFKYIAINVGYWLVCFALMGGVICQWA